MVYYSGDYLVICDMCGLERLRSQCLKNWKGQIVCASTCYEERHPLDLPSVGRKEKQNVPDHRPEIITFIE